MSKCSTFKILPNNTVKSINLVAAKILTITVFGDLMLDTKSRQNNHDDPGSLNCPGPLVFN